MVFEAGDCIAKCPIGCWWIYCVWCQKFVWQRQGDREHCHRRSKRHIKNLAYLEYYGVEDMVQMVAHKEMKRPCLKASDWA